MHEPSPRKLLERVRGVRVVVCGDLCLDAYWTLHPGGSEVSVETGVQAMAVADQRCSLGGAANVAANVAALAPARLAVLGTVGEDLFARELLGQLQAMGADTDGVIAQADNFATFAYCKPYLHGVEQPRIDFGTLNRRSAETDAALLGALERAMAWADVVILNQQVPGSIPGSSFIARVNGLLQEFPDTVALLDSRDYGAEFRGVYRKTNVRETARLHGIELERGQTLPLPQLERLVEALYRESGKPVFATRAEEGILVCDESGSHDVPGIPITEKIDPVGAGDTVVSALACALGAGATPVEAAVLANCAAAVTVQKRYRTGTASPDEILALAQAGADA